MKDYSMNLEERKKFILGYKIKSGFMKVKYALGFKDKIPYNEENEAKVLDKMKGQVLKVNKDKFIKTKKNNIMFDFAVGTGCSIGSILFFCTGINSGLEIVAWIMGSVFAIGGIILIPSGFMLINVLNDYKKNRRFIDIEDDINKKVRENDNMIVNTSSKTKKMVKSAPEDRPVFNINSFNYVPNRDLEQIVENIDRDEYFGYNYDEISITKNKPKTRRKTKK